MSERKPYSSPAVRSYKNALPEAVRRKIAWLVDEERLTPSVIAERLGLHRNTVLKWMRRLGLVEQRRCGCGRVLRLAGGRCYVCRGYRESTRGAPRDEWKRDTAEVLVQRWLERGGDGLSKEQVLEVLKGGA